MKPDIVQTQSWRYKTIVVIQRHQQNNVWIIKALVNDIIAFKMNQKLLIWQLEN